MNFEDLLKPKKDPENYVMAPEKKEEPNKLQQFLAERTLEPKVEPKITADGTLPEPKKEAIKKIFSPPQQPVLEDDGTDALMGAEASTQTTTREPYSPEQTDMYQYSQQTYQPVATSDLIDMKKIKEQVDSAMPEKTWGDYIKYLAPLATEAILGGGKTFVSGGIASKMIKEDLTKEEAKRKSLEDKLMEIQKARQLAAMKASGKGKYLEVDMNGKPIIMRAEDALGKQAWKKPETNNFAQKVALEKLKANLRMKVAEGKATEAERKELRKIEMDLAQKWSTDPFTRDTRTVTDAYNKLSKVDPYSADPVKDIAVIFDFMKTLDPNSVVRESEQGLVMGARSVGDIWDNLFEVQSGERKLTPDQIKNIQIFASKNYQRRLESQKSMVDTDFSKRALRYGLDPDMVIGQLSVGVPLLWSNPKTGKTRVITAQPDQVEDLLKVPGVTKVQ